MAGNGGNSEIKRKIAERIADYEKRGLWDKDVTDDPPAVPLTLDKADYLCEKPFSKTLTKIANRLAVRYFEKEIKKGNFRIKAVHGIENYLKVKDGGAIITCNHFSIYDHYAVYRTIREYFPKGGQLYKVIKEGNYTAFKGLFGFFFRHCNTLPLAESPAVMIKFMKAADVLLKRGEKILVYPEQAMWLNYEKPRPLKSGAFRLAVKSGVPVLPVFITMEDSDRLDADGDAIRDFTLWFSEPIYGRTELSAKDNETFMRDENYKVWKEIYERAYHTPLSYER